MDIIRKSEKKERENGIEDISFIIIVLTDHQVYVCICVSQEGLHK